MMLPLSLCFSDTYTTIGLRVRFPQDGVWPTIGTYRRFLIVIAYIFVSDCMAVDHRVFLQQRRLYLHRWQHLQLRDDWRDAKLQEEH